MTPTNMPAIHNFNNTPVLFAPQHVDAVSALAGAPKRGSEEAVAAADMYAALCAAMVGAPITDARKPFIFSNGLAYIPVHGVLLHRDNWADEYATGYDYIRSRLGAALADPDVQGIVFDIHSPGGQVAGNFELADMIYDARQQKPMMAVVDGYAFSAAYSIASAVGNINLSPSSMAGSIGVVTMHVSMQGMLDKWGIKVTFIHAGAHKVDGNAFQDLPEAVQADFQARIDKLYDGFVAQVARNRGIDAQAVRDTEARCYDADTALSLNLIDAISMPFDAVAAFRQSLSGSTISMQGVSDMSDNTQAGAAPTAPAAAAAPTAADERARIQGITTHEEANGRGDLATHLAFNTDMSVEQAVAVLAAAPKKEEAAASTAASNAFAAAMDSTTNPNVGGNAGGDAGAEGGTEDRVARITQNYARATGIKLVKS